MIQKSYDDSKCLYLIPTPIGNLEDITIRALKILEFVDIILCEDTRNTGILLSKYKIKKRMICCHEHNENKVVDRVISLLKNGNNIGIVTDQGTPVISDPGFEIVRGVINAGYNVIALPGATAFVPALIVSGINPSPFLFYGFLNSKSSKQKSELKSLANVKYTLIFYESVHRIKLTLENMLEIFGDRNIVLCREISKIYEEVCRDKISNILSFIDDMKGEFVLIVEGNNNITDYSNMDIIDHVSLYLDDGLSEKEAIKIVAKERNVAKSVIYNNYHNRK